MRSLSAEASAGGQQLDLHNLQRVAGESAFYPVEGGAVVYYPPAKCLFALNVTAALAWLNLRAGTPRQSITDEFAAVFGLEGEEAEQWVARTLNSLAGTKFDVVGTGDAAERSVAERPLLASARGTDYLLLDQTLRIDAGEGAARLIELHARQATATGNRCEKGAGPCD